LQRTSRAAEVDKDESTSTPPQGTLTTYSAALAATEPRIPQVIDQPALLRDLVQCLSLTQSPTKSLSQIGCFIWFVPARLGICRALDDAVSCLCAAYTAFLSSKPVRGKSGFTRALQALQLSLRDEKEAMSAEVLCASICLSWYGVSVVHFPKHGLQR
jgi:hypothetical protein